MIRNILRYTVIGIAVGIVSYIGLTAYGEITQTEAVKASEAYQLAQAQAQNMSQALTEVSTFGTTSQQQPAEQSETRSEPVAGQNSIPKSFAGSKGSQDTSSAGNALETQPTTPPDIAKITNIDALIAEWEPRYDAAIVAYVKLEASISNAKSRATDYLAQQQVLTEQIQNPENQSKALREDEREISLYRQWEAKADSTLHTAAQIGIQLDDMDAYLKKLSLRADFVFDPRAIAFSKTMGVGEPDSVPAQRQPPSIFAGRDVFNLSNRKFRRWLLPPNENAIALCSTHPNSKMCPKR